MMIPSHVQADANVRQNDDLYRLLVENANEAVFVVRDDIVHYANPMTQALFQRPESAIVGQPVRGGLLPENWDECIDDPTQTALGERHRLHRDLRIFCPDGQTRWISLDTVQTVWNGVAITLNFASDVTQRRQAEAVTQMHLALIEYAAVHSVPEVLQHTLDQVTELTGSTIGFYHFVESDQQNLSLQAWSTRTLNEFCRAQGRGLHYPVTQAGVWADCVKTRKPVVHNDYASLPHRKGLPPGHAVVVRELIVPIIRAGKVAAILGVGNKPVDYIDADVDIVTHFAELAWEIVDRRRFEEALRKREEEQHHQERLAAIGQLAAGIAHDFNNVLAVIALQLPMLARASSAIEKERKRIDVIQGQVNHAAHLIQQILDFSRRAVLERRPLDLAQLLRAQIDLLAYTLPETIQIRLECEPGPHMAVLDLSRMQQLVMNLAVNARDAMPKGGQLSFVLTLYATPPRPNLAPGPWLSLRVADTGSGIAPAHLPHIFEPFFTTKDPAQFSGLGLPQVHGIVKQHGGEIEVASNQGEGTTFTVFLPALQETTNVAVSPQAPTSTSGAQTILIAEDNPILLAALQETVEMLGYTTIVVRNGLEALDRLGEGQPAVDLVLSDLVMPGMGGEDLLISMRQRGLKQPVLFLSGHPLMAETPGLGAEGATGWLPKPVEMDLLAQTLTQMLAQSST